MMSMRVHVGFLVAAVLLPSMWAVRALALETTTDDGLLEKVEEAVSAGRFSEAELMLRAQIAEPDGPVVGPYATQLEIIRRIRLDYSLTGEDMLAKLRKVAPDVTVSDIDRWREQGVLQFRPIDGQIRYFKREPSNLFRFCEEARSRRSAAKQPRRAGWKFSLPAHLARLLDRARRSGEAEVFPVKHEITYRLAVHEGHPRLKPGAKVRCWLPFPQEYRQQKSVRLLSAEPAGAVVAPNGHPQRTIYFEQTIVDPSKPPVFTAEFEFVTYGYCPDLDPAKVRPYDRDAALFQEYTAERPPHIVFTPEVRRIVADVAGDEPNPLLRAKKLFRWENDNIRYCSEMEYSTIANISDKALTSGKGDCGVQGLLFITLCRAAGIPARWQSGWESEPNAWNMHDWAEFYIEPWGWLPADPSYGLQKHDDPRVREFYCGHLDPYRMIVNLDYARELSPPKTSFRSEPNDFQRGEIEIDGHNLYFDEWDWTFDVRTVPLEGGLTALEEAMDAAVPDLLTDGKMSGAVIAVGRKTADGWETWRKAYGYKQTEPSPAPMPEDAVFDMASLSKPIAAGTSLMVLADQGKVDVGDPVGKYLPEFNEGDKKDVTIRHLMTHTSGERPYVHADEQKKLKAEGGFPCRDLLREHIRKLDLIHKPGEVVHYSCLNAILAAEVVRVISGMEHSDFAAKHVFEPLGLKETGFLPPERLSARMVPTTQTDYGRGEGGFLLGQVHDPLAAMQGGVSGNAGLFSTAADLSRFARMMLSGGELDGVRILERKTVEQMTRVQNPGAKNTKGKPDRRGLLWDIYQPDPGDTGVDALYAFGHTGYTGPAIRFYPQQGVYVIALANRVHPDDSGKVAAFRRNVWRIVGETLMGVSAGAPAKADVPPPGGPTTRASPAPEPSSAAAGPPGQRVGPDGIGELCVPSAFQLSDGRLDVLVHFHGGFQRVASAAEEARITSAVVNVSRPGLSSVYEKPFSDTALFRAIIDDAIRTLTEGGTIPPDTELGRVYVSSFSAGFGAVRAILGVPEYLDLIDGIVMADSLYCGYDGPAENRKPDARRMGGFRRFAAEAEAGRKLMLVTHSAQVPGRYASTTETADDLIAHVGAERRAVDPGDGHMRLVSQADAGGFHVRGFAGGEGSDHMAHLRHLGVWYRMLPVSLARGDTLPGAKVRD
ncbi:MAG: serine hydrolase [Phycisphaerales bacterium]|nr:MAG: serine hydrolase [Phycisphaerales bacterium]